MSLTRYIEVEMQAVNLFLVRVTSPSKPRRNNITMEFTVIMSAGGGPAVRCKKCVVKSPLYNSMDGKYRYIGCTPTLRPGKDLRMD